MVNQEEESQSRDKLHFGSSVNNVAQNVSQNIFSKERRWNIWKANK